MVLIANKNDCFELNVAGKVILSSSEVSLLGITIDNKFFFLKKTNIFINSVGNHFISFLLSRE